MKILCFPIQKFYRFDLTLKCDFKTNINYPIISFTCSLLTVSNQMPKNTTRKPIDFAFPTTTFPIQFLFCVLNFLLSLARSCLNTHMAQFIRCYTRRMETIRADGFEKFFPSPRIVQTNTDDSLGARHPNHFPGARCSVVHRHHNARNNSHFARTSNLNGSVKKTTIFSALEQYANSLRVRDFTTFTSNSNQMLPFDCNGTASTIASHRMICEQ